ncbi:MAG: 3'-5' exonuclease [Metamycoplasmataceae bacterium]
MYIYFDLETTGFNPVENEIIEIYLLKEDRAKNIVATYHAYFNPGIKLPIEIKRITKITDKILKNKKTFKEHALEIIDFIGDDILIGHNVDSFDLPFLNGSLAKNNFPTLQNKTYDTMKMAREMDKVNVYTRGYKLIDLAIKYNLNIDAKKFHDAKYDTEITRKIFHILKGDLND